MTPEEAQIPLSSDARSELRRRQLAAAPRGYSPWLHLAIPSAVGVAVVTVAVLLLRDLRLWELLAVPVTFVLANAGEWRIHKGALHHRWSVAPVLYDQHTPIHHRLYVTEDMAIRDTKELRLVLIPAYGIFLIVVAVLIPAVPIWLLGLHNVALLFVATCVGYAVSYEWLHLSYHLPEDSFVGRLRLIQVLRRHHATHHSPRLMQKWNFNVTVPLWDWVRGTIYGRVASRPARRLRGAFPAPPRK